MAQPEDWTINKILKGPTKLKSTICSLLPPYEAQIRLLHWQSSKPSPPSLREAGRGRTSSILLPWGPHSNPFRRIFGRRGHPWAPAVQEIKELKSSKLRWAEDTVSISMETDSHPISELIKLSVIYLAAVEETTRNRLVRPQMHHRQAFCQSNGLRRLRRFCPFLAEQEVVDNQLPKWIHPINFKQGRTTNLEAVIEMIDWTHPLILREAATTICALATDHRITHYKQRANRPQDRQASRSESLAKLHLVMCFQAQASSLYLWEGRLPTCSRLQCNRLTILRARKLTRREYPLRSM